MSNTGTNWSQGNHVHLEIELLSAYIDGEVTPDETALVERHLPVCRHCREELESLRWTVNLLREMPPVAVPHSFVIRPVAVEKAEERRRLTRPDWLLNGLQWATVATAVLAMLVFAADFLNIGQPVAAPALMQVAQSERAAPMVAEEAEVPAVEEKEAAPPPVTVQTEREKVVELAGGPQAAPTESTAPRQPAAPPPSVLATAQLEAEGQSPESVPQAGAKRETMPPSLENQAPREANNTEPTPTPGFAHEAPAVPGPTNPLRPAEVGLTGLFVVLLGLTLLARWRRAT